MVRQAHHERFFKNGYRKKEYALVIEIASVIGIAIETDLASDPDSDRMMNRYS